MRMVVKSIKCIHTHVYVFTYRENKGNILRRKQKRGRISSAVVSTQEGQINNKRYHSFFLCSSSLIAIRYRWTQKWLKPFKNCNGFINIPHMAAYAILGWIHFEMKIGFWAWILGKQLKDYMEWLVLQMFGICWNGFLGKEINLLLVLSISRKFSIHTIYPVAKNSTIKNSRASDDDRKKLFRFIVHF